MAAILRPFETGTGRLSSDERPPALPVPLAVEIAALEARLGVLRARQRGELVAVISVLIGPGIAFSARELFDHRLVSPELGAALEAAGLTSVRQLGKKLRQLGLSRIGVEHNAALWMIA